MKIEQKNDFLETPQESCCTPTRTYAVLGGIAFSLSLISFGLGKGENKPFVITSGAMMTLAALFFMTPCALNYYISLRGRAKVHDENEGLDELSERLSLLEQNSNYTSFKTPYGNSGVQ